ncbi:hypothetical protein J7E87_28530 [Streptomyces sp. ISL-1]|uniref:hypothetical protein n=1 Tax=Streptomyces sp. ISL-1 TaxID=2817657 RepID=UPI001BEACDAE|nr:hypothetical protein [Streptomyces sp. ISL-1]MBT2393270.1 hypothetical protein [Streptomyces sp. ISL-1]
MGVLEPIRRWPLNRQLTGSDPLGRGRAVVSAGTEALRPRTGTADRVVQCVCPSPALSAMTGRKARR